MPKKLSHIVLLVCVFLWASLSFGFLVVIDPGHGGNDGGAKSDDAKESSIVLSVSNLLAAALKADGRFEVKMTRQRDEFVTLEERADFANKAKADLFISIHTNWSEDPKARGKEIYFQNQLPPDEESLFLASRENQGKKTGQIENAPTAANDVNSILNDLRRSSRIQASGHFAEALFKNWPQDGVKRHTPLRQAPFFVISNLNMPSALVELGYLSHAQEGARLMQPEFQKQLAESLRNGIIQFKEMLDKRPSSHLN